MKANHLCNYCKFPLNIDGTCGHCELVAYTQSLEERIKEYEDGLCSDDYDDYIVDNDRANYYW